MNKSFLIQIIFALAFSSLSKAQFIELGGSASYKKTNFAPGAYDQSSSLTASMSYIFDEMSAVELSYTNGVSKQSVPTNLVTNGVVDNHNTTVFYELIGLDLVLTMGSADWTIRPYIKAGTAFILRKRLIDQIENFPASPPDDEPTGFVPSAGFGFKLTLTKSLSLKAGVEAWTSAPLVGGQSSPSMDVSARAGLSWLF